MSALRLPPRDQRDTLKIGELAEELGITPRTIRLYEELGLIAPNRTQGGTRLYHRKDAKRLAVVLRLARLGMELGELQRLPRSGNTATPGPKPSLRCCRCWVNCGPGWKHH